MEEFGDISTSQKHLLSPQSKFGGSLVNLNLNDAVVSGGSSEEVSSSNEFKEKPGLIRRAFSSKRRKTPTIRVDPQLAQGSRLGENFHQSWFPLQSNSGQDLFRTFQDFSDTLHLDKNLVSRRSVFSRKHNSSKEMLIQIDSEDYMNYAGRFRMETGCYEREVVQISGPLNTPLHLENPEAQTRWYFKYFLGKVHQIFAGTDSDKAPFVLAIVLTDAVNQSVVQYRTILWQETGSQKLCLPYNTNNPLTIKKILNCLNLKCFDRCAKEILNPDVQKDVLTLEEQEGSVNFKFGVLYMKNGQICDEDMYNNEQGSAQFESFVNLLGDRVKLSGWDKFKGGLDTLNGTSGLESVYTVYEGHEIMFHVSTMLPYSLDNRQQVDRKRHIGNDIVNIIFIDECNMNQPYNWRPVMMKTHFTHIFALVLYDNLSDCYRLHLSAEESVPFFGPALPSPPEFYNKQQFRDFLLAKLINGEKAAFHSQVFAKKRQRTLDMLLRNILDDYTNDAKISSINRRGFNDIIFDQQNGGSSNKKDESRNLEFIRKGQSLKLKIILRGDAPTSLVTSCLTKQEPWQPQLMFSQFYQNIVCGDTWGDRMIACTEFGTFLLEDVQNKMIIDRSLIVKQISIIETLAIMILRVDKGKESRIFVFPMDYFDGFGMTDDTAFSKSTAKDKKIEKTKGCHLFCLSKTFMNPLRMVVAVGRKLQIYCWKLLTTCNSLSTWNQFTENQIASGFQFIRELPTFEAAQVMTLLYGCSGANRICIGYRNQYDLIDEKTGDTLRIFRHDFVKAQVIAAIDIYADDEAELLLCLNRTCHFQKICMPAHCLPSRIVSGSSELSPFSSSSTFLYPAGTSISTGQLYFCWNIEPRDIVVAFPYVLGFADNAIEFRMIINGNLVHNMNVPGCRLITSKFDIYFISSISTLAQEICERVKDVSKLPMDPFQSAAPQENLTSSQTNESEYYYIYRILSNNLSQMQ